MKKNFYSSLLLSSFVLFSFSAGEPILANNKYNDANPVSVRIEQSIGNPTTLTVQLIGDYTITSLSDKSLYKKVKNQTFTLSISKSKLKMNSESKTYSDLKFTPLKESSENLIKLNNNLSYLGVMDFTIENIIINRKTKETIQPRNTLRINNYLLGVVPNEMPSTWHEEALKAQTVSARTYLHQKLQTDADIFEDTVLYQVYKGYKSNPKIENIIKSTSNEILLHNNRPAETFYSSSNGGFVNSTKGYGWNALPYSVDKCDPFDPKNTFTSKIDEKTLIDKVLKNSSIKEIKKITYSLVGDNGRPSYVYFETDKGKFSVTMKDFRNRLNYDILKNTLIISSSYDGSTLTINGYGWGHGIGMSQYGAKTMANQKLSYKQILGFYYSGVSLNGEKLSYTPKKVNNCSKPTIKVNNTTPTPPPTQTTKPTEKPSITTTKEVKIYTVNTKTGTLSLRKSASTGSKILANIPKGKTVKFLKDFNKKWFYVEYDGKKGYVSKDYIKVTTVKSSNSTSQKLPTNNSINNTSSNNAINSSNKIHVVKKGDTLYGISKKYKTTVNKIVSLNKLKNTNISIGQKLKIK